MRDESDKTRIRVLGYIWQIFRPPAGAPSGAEAEFVGFATDMTIEADCWTGETPFKELLYHAGDGILYATLSEAQAAILRDTGMQLMPIAEPLANVVPVDKFKHSRHLSAAYVAEFRRTGKLPSQIQAESVLAADCCPLEMKERPRLRIFGQIFRHHGSRNPEARRWATKDYPSKLLGYSVSTRVEGESWVGDDRHYCVIEQRDSSEIPYFEGELPEPQFLETYMRAQEFAIRWPGIWIEPFPDRDLPPAPTTGEAKHLVGLYFGEFEPTDAPRGQVEAESGMPNPGSEHGVDPATRIRKG